MNRLREAVRHSRLQLAPFRKNRLTFARQIAGNNYSENGSDKPVPLNMISMAVQVYLPNLVSSTPQVSVSTNAEALRGQSFNLQIEINHVIDEIDFDLTLRMIVLDALIGMGISKTALKLEGEIDYGHVKANVNKAFASRIDLDHWVHDSSARHYDEVQFAGDRYQLSLPEAREYPLFDKIARQNLVATHRGDGEPEDRVENLSRDDRTPDEGEIEESVFLWDIWLPRDNLIVTIPDGHWDRPLRVWEWDGAEGGPYDLLAFNRLPNNIMPVPPVAHLSDLHELINSLIRKLGRQARNQKTVGAARAGKHEDAQRIVDADDLEVVVADPSSLGEFKFGGIDQQTLGFMLQMRSLFSMQGGNLDSLGGLRPQADTVGQERLLGEAANKRMEDMQEQTVRFVTQVVRKIAWYEWTDPLVDRRLNKTIDVPGAKVSVPFRITPELREGDFLDYNFSIDPHSLRRQSPGEKMAAIMQIFQTIIQPSQQQMAAQGMTVDYPGLIQLISRTLNLPELDEILISDGNPPSEDPFSQGVSGVRGTQPQPTTTHRINERVNRTTGTPAGLDQQLAQTFMAGARDGFPGGSQNANAA